MLRVLIETSIESPFALVVSSAVKGDGKSVCAHGLALSMAAARHRTLLVDLDHNDLTLTAAPQMDSIAANGEAEDLDRFIVFDARSGLSFLSLTHDGLSALASKENVVAFLGRLRNRFAAIVVDAACLPDSSIGVLFASACDGVILTTREGRSVKSRDRVINELLERNGARFLGVVTIARRTINAFAPLSFKPQANKYTSPIGAVAPRVEAPTYTTLMRRASSEV
jgi:Mrp family chromosome partitioning ATPase